MGLGLAAGHPNYSSDGDTKFIPEIWSTNLLVKFYAATVFGDITNTEYEGEIKKMGDKVHIRTTPDVQIKTYKKGMKLTYENLESDSVELNIDQGEYFAFLVDSVDAYQSDLSLIDDWSNDASEQMKQKIDTGILGSIYADAHASNTGLTAGADSSSYNMGVTGTPVGVTKSNILDYLVDMGSVLDEQNIPEADRFVVIPTWMAGLIKKSDLKDASLAGDGTSIMRNGRLGMIDRFTLYSSNNYTKVTDGANTCYNTLFGHKSATTFASQMTEMDTLKAESAFGELVRGLNVFGYETIKPESLGNFYCYKG